MEKRYVIDTTGFITYYKSFFNETNDLTKSTRRIIDNCFSPYMYEYKLVIPSVVFIEIFYKFLVDEEITRKFYYEIYSQCKDNEFVEIKPIEKDVLESFKDLSDFKLENFDRIIYASAIQLNSILITNDTKIISYNNKQALVPSIIF